MKNLCKRLWKEILILLLQLLIFFVFPLFADSAEPLGMVLSILSATSMLSILLGCVSKKKIKYIYPIITALFFLPTVFIYYNSSALIHAVWYLTISAIGIGIGIIINKCVSIIFKKKNSREHLKP